MENTYNKLSLLEMKLSSLSKKKVDGYCAITSPIVYDIENVTSLESSDYDSTSGQLFYNMSEARLTLKCLKRPPSGISGNT